MRVDLHCHSDASDGYYSPAEVARLLAEEGVEFAALTDHQSVAGLPQFHESASREGLTEFAGAEFHARLDVEEIHLLAYGFDPQSEHLHELLATVPPAARVIAAVHAAGGIVFLAHPLTLGSFGGELDATVERLAALGLDGLEAFYKPYDSATQLKLADLADRLGLLTSAGSDYHGPNGTGARAPGVEMPVARWKQFREALGDDARNGRHVKPDAEAEPIGAGAATRASSRGGSGEINWRWLVLRIALPSVLVIGFFTVLLFAILIPAMEQRLLDRKREMVSELTNSAWSIIADYHREAIAGELTDEEARRAAIGRIRRLRYGPDDKDYFWITDMHPRMVMHPYREDLEDADLTDFTDPDGVRPFVRFVEAVREHSSGYVTYVWQWQDDPDRLEAKESYVRGFEPWGWIIGTGLYVDDVQREIQTITGRMIDASFIVTVIAAGLLSTISWQSLKVERRRSAAERDLRLSHERYQALVEASTSGTLLLVQGRCTYANRTLLDMLGYTASELAFLDVHDIVRHDDEESARLVDAIANGTEVREGVDARLVRKDDAEVPVLLSVSAVYFSGRQALILTAQDVARHQALREELGESRERYETLARVISDGVLLASMDHDTTVLQMNPAAYRILGLREHESPMPSLRSVVVDAAAYQSFRRRLESDYALQDMIVQVRKGDGGYAMVRLSAVRSEKGAGGPGLCTAIVEDVTERRRTESERENLISQLQSSLLFLTEPVGNSMSPPVATEVDTSIIQAVRTMNRNDADAVAVVGSHGELLGIVTDHDIRERVVAVGLDSTLPVSRIMSAPVVTISETAPLFEAFMLERERGIDHLAVTDSASLLVGIVRSSRSVRLDRYSLVVLIHQIRRANTIDELSECHARLPILVGSLVETGARAQNICHVTTAVSDAIVERVIALSLEQLGTPPVRFAFLALGSEAREEQTLATDQDNALVYEDAPEAADVASDYFLRLGELVCDALDRIGYRHCRGETMAKNPRWNQPLRRWKRLFDEWMSEPDAPALARCNVFFDMRCVYGDCSLIRELRRHVDDALAVHPAFLSHMALGTLQYKAPVGLFGRIVTGSAGDPVNTFNIKEAMIPIVNFARLYALRHHLEETNTFDRLEHLAALEVLSDESYRSLSQAYSQLMQLRYRHQVNTIASGRPADNSIDPHDLTQLDTAMLKNVLSRISTIQKKVGYEFRVTG